MTITATRIVGVLGLVVAAALLLVVPADANTATSLKMLEVCDPYFPRDQFINYDFTDPATDWTQGTVDWTMSMLFVNDAEVDRIKDAYWGRTAAATSKHAHINDDNKWAWDDDRGTKTGGCFSGDYFKHMRLYAVGDGDRNYNRCWGYWVIGSTHLDYEVCLGSKAYGWSELAEYFMAEHASHMIFWHVWRNWGSFYNYEPPRWEGNNFWDYDGVATAVWVP